MIERYLNDYRKAPLPISLTEQDKEQFDAIIFNEQFDNVYLDLGISENKESDAMRIKFVQCRFSNKVILKNSTSRRLSISFDDCVFEGLSTCSQEPQALIACGITFSAHNCKFSKCSVNIKGNEKWNWSEFNFIACELSQCYINGEFNNCTVHMKCCNVANCEFQNITYQTTDISEIIQSKFHDCIFKNINISGDLNLYVASCLFEKCSLENIEWYIEGFLECEFCDIAIKNAKLFQGYLKNSKLVNISLSSVKLFGEMEENTTNNVKFQNFSISPLP